MIAKVWQGRNYTFAATAMLPERVRSKILRQEDTGHPAGFEKHGLTLLHLKDEDCSPQRMSKEIELAVDALNLLYRQDGCYVTFFYYKSFVQKLDVGVFSRHR